MVVAEVIVVVVVAAAMCYYYYFFFGRLAVLEADLSDWVTDLKREEQETRSRGGGEKKVRDVKQEEERVDSDDDDEIEEKEEEQKGKDEEDGERNRTSSPPLLTPADLPPLDTMENTERSRSKGGQKLHDPLGKVRTGKNSPRTLIQDITKDSKVKIPVSYPLNKVMSTRRSPRSLIEVVDDHESLESGNRSAEEVKVTVDQKADEPIVITHKASGSVIKVTGGQHVEGVSSRQVEALLREAERQQAEGDLLSASLSYNKVLMKG